MDNFNPGTLFIGQESIFLKETDSTNAWINRQQKMQQLSHGCLVHTDFQQQGKGRLERSWVSDSGQNLLFSVLLRPAGLTLARQSFLSFLTGLSVADTISQFVSMPIYLKWPNDVICENKKVAGILIENQLKGQIIDRSIVGVGINVNQTAFPAEIPATSIFQLNGVEVSRKAVLETFCKKLEARYLQLLQTHTDLLLQEYNSKLYRNGQEVWIQQDQKIRNGVIQGVDAEGCIQIVTNGVLNRYPFNSVKILYDGFNS